MTRTGFVETTLRRTLAAAVGALAVATVAASAAKPRQVPPSAVPSSALPVAAPIERIEVALGDLPPRGPENARVRIVAFTDYQCPYCAKAAATLTEVQARHPNDVALYLRDLPLAMHTDAFGAARAVRCAARQGRVWPMHDALFSHRDQLAISLLPELAGPAGLDGTAFYFCLTSQTPDIDDAIRRDLADAERLGVQATPTFFVNGEKISGAQPAERFEQAVRDALEADGRR